jgi:hypothetical protein
VHDDTALLSCPALFAGARQDRLGQESMPPGTCIRLLFGTTDGVVLRSAWAAFSFQKLPVGSYQLLLCRLLYGIYGDYWQAMGND